jgi:hypothetical protein
MPFCPVCQKNEMQINKWTLTYDKCSCVSCNIMKYWNKEEKRFATDKEINDMEKIWE